MDNRILNRITLALILIGGLNWGLVGLFAFNLVGAIFGELSLLSRIIYILVGLSAVHQLVLLLHRLKAPTEEATHTAHPA